MHFIKDRGYNAPLAEGITPRSVLEHRRGFLKQLAAGSAGPALALWAGREALAQGVGPGKLAALPGARSAVSGAVTMEKVTSYADVTGYNNFYEFGTEKEDPAQHAPKLLRTRPWQVVVDGEVRRPRTFGIDELLRLAPMEERISRLEAMARGGQW